MAQVVFSSWIIKNLNFVFKPFGIKNLGKIALAPYFFWMNSKALKVNENINMVKQNIKHGSSINNEFRPKNLV